MRYLFEDGDDSILLNFLRKGYIDPSIIKGTYGVGQIKNYIEDIGKEEQIFIFMDLVPDNPITYSEYIKLVTMRNNGYNIMVFPVPCTEYFFIKAFDDTHILKHSRITELALKRGVITNTEVDGEKRKNYEKFCKAILHGLVLDCAALDNKSERFRLYYEKDCACDKSYSHCADETLVDKAKNVLKEYPCIPAGSKYETHKLSFSECVLIHRKLIDEYNEAVERYITASPELMSKYKKAPYMY